MPMPNRQYSLSSGAKYCFGFNGQEKDDEVYGEGNLNTAEFWEYDTRIGRRWNVDPVVKIHLSPYNCFSSNPIVNADPSGDDDFITNTCINTTYDDNGGIVTQEKFESTYVIKNGCENRYLSTTENHEFYSDGKTYTDYTMVEHKGSDAGEFLSNKWSVFGGNYSYGYSKSYIPVASFDEQHYSDALTLKNNYEEAQTNLGYFTTAVFTLASLFVPEIRCITSEELIGVQANRAAGNLYRDELAAALEAEGRTVFKEVYKETPFGKRYIDLDVWYKGESLGGIECKVGQSRYHSLQRMKDDWLRVNGDVRDGIPYNVFLGRKPLNW
jgi:hypothetical protein